MGGVSEHGQEEEFSQDPQETFFLEPAESKSNDPEDPIPRHSRSHPMDAETEKMKRKHARSHHSVSTKSAYKKCANKFSRTTDSPNTKEQGWKMNNTLPPKELLRDHHFLNYFAKVWTKCERSAVIQGTAYLNWCLRHYGYPNINSNAHLFLKTDNFLKSIKKTDRWRHYQTPNKGKSLTDDECQQLGTCPIRNQKGQIVLDWLRDKTIFMSLVHMGYHPKDVYIMKKKNLKD